MRFLFVSALIVCCEATFHTLSSNGPTNWGTWGEFELCPLGEFVIGYSIRVEPKGAKDKNGLNDIKFICGKIGEEIINKQDEQGFWSESSFDGYAMEFDDGKSKDRVGATWVWFTCLKKKIEQSDEQYINRVKGNWNQNGADISKWKTCKEGYRICGIQTQVEKLEQNGDDTAMNNIRTVCCPNDPTHFWMTTEFSTPSNNEWCDWGEVAMCPEGTYVTAFNTRLYKGTENDNRDGLTALKLYCNPIGKTDLNTTISSKIGNMGKWGQGPQVCKLGAFAGFKYRLTSDGKGTDLHLICNSLDPTSDDQCLRPIGLGNLNYDREVSGSCPKGSHICGIQSEVEEIFEASDSKVVTIKNIRVVCCKL